MSDAVLRAGARDGATAVHAAGSAHEVIGPVPQRWAQHFCVPLHAGQPPAEGVHALPSVPLEPDPELLPLPELDPLLPPLLEPVAAESLPNPASLPAF